MKIRKLSESKKTNDYLSIKEINWLKDNPGHKIKKTHYEVSYNDYINANTNEPMSGHFTVIENQGRNTTRVDDVQELKDYIVRKYNKYFEESISSNEPVVKFQGKSFHAFTKDKRWEIDFDEAGNILARTRHGKPFYFKGHINDKTNDFSSTDEDNIIHAAREQHKLKFGNKEVKEGWYEDHLDNLQRKTSGYDACYKIVKKARTSNPIDWNALDDACDHFGYDLYKMCLDDVLKEMNNFNESLPIKDDLIYVRDFAVECKESGHPVENYAEFAAILKDDLIEPTRELYKEFLRIYNKHSINESKSITETSNNYNEFEKLTDNSNTDMPEPGLGTGLSNAIIALINDEWEAIDGYNSFIATLAAEDVLPEAIDIIKDIANEENLHIGQLQKLLQMISPNVDSIAKGEEEAEKQIQDAETSESE